MSKFKVGDIVRVITDEEDYPEKAKLGKITQIMEGNPFPYAVNIPGFYEKTLWLEEELELVEERCLKLVTKCV